MFGCSPIWTERGCPVTQPIRLRAESKRLNRHRSRRRLRVAQKDRVSTGGGDVGPRRERQLIVDAVQLVPDEVDQFVNLIDQYSAQSMQVLTVSGVNPSFIKERLSAILYEKAEGNTTSTEQAEGVR